ncbi:MAG TPA: hypothetical protein VGV08_00100 [Casimicrobiaceae bacterium]|nr:hypothetical protein [Casimicrobiaceae bacterium]
MPFAYYDRLSAARKRIYRASDAIGTLGLPDGVAAGVWVAGIRRALAADDRRALRRACQDLVAALTRGYRVPPLAVRVLAQRPADGDGELHGLYEPEDGGMPATVSVWMRTAARGQVVAFRTFLRTLCHEICHHLDYELFALEETFHTEGFYKRESSLASALLSQETPGTTAPPGAAESSGAAGASPGAARSGPAGRTR